MATVDLTIRGAGIFGLSIAWVARRRDANVRVVDPFGVGAGASGGIVGALAPHTPDNWNDKKQFQLESLLANQTFWAEVDAVSGLSSGYARVGRIQPLPDARQIELAYERETGHPRFWGDSASWQVTDGQSWGTWLPPSPTGLYAHDTLSARIHPRNACQSLAGALAGMGVQIEADATDQGRIIWATGLAGLEELNAEHGRPIGSGVKGQAALLRHSAVNQPQIFSDSIHIVPHGDGTVAVGSTSEREYDDPNTTDSSLDQLIARAVAQMPVLRDADMIERWASVRPRAKSRSPMLGAWPGRPGHFIANGGFKIGFGVAVKVAEVMTDLVLEGRDAIPIGFRPEANF